MNKSESINEIAGAMAKAQLEIENASKNAANPHFRSKYADLAEVLNTVRPVFARHGLAIIQSPAYEAGHASVETTIAHSSGQWMSSTVTAPVSKQDAQGVGSALTYCRRYGLAAMAGIAQEDDDGNAQEDDDGNAAVAGHGRSAPKPPPVKAPTKLKITDDRLGTAIEKINAGEYSVKALNERFNLTPEQTARVQAEADISGGEK